MDVKSGWIMAWSFARSVVVGRLVAYYAAWRFACLLKLSVRG